MNGLSGGFVGAGAACLCLAVFLFHGALHSTGKAWTWRVHWGSAALIAGGFLTGFGATL